MPDDELLYRGKRFDVVRRRERLPSGDDHFREVVVHPGAVLIVPWLDGDRVCLIRNRRIAVEKTLIELPAGTLEPGEDPMVTAKRELIEETGYRAGRIEYQGGFYMSPGILSERMHVFLASGLIPGDTARESGEQIENLEVPWIEALRMVDDGEIDDSKTIAALLLHERRRARSGT
jgi:ADP-ribose pyrophosphatase